MKFIDDPFLHIPRTHPLTPSLLCKEGKLTEIQCITPPLCGAERGPGGEFMLTQGAKGVGGMSSENNGETGKGVNYKKQMNTLFRLKNQW